MSKMTETVKKELILAGLFWRTYIIIDYKTEGLLNACVDKWGASYKSGPTTIETAATFQLHKEGFKKFLIKLENLADQEESTRKIPTGWLMRHKPKEAERLMLSQQNKREMFYKAYAKFKDKYREALGVILLKSGDRIYFDTQFYPRNAEEQGYFSRFLKAFLILEWRKRLNIQGPKTGTQSIPSQLLRLAEAMRRKGKGTKAGSLDTITAAVMEGMGHSLKCPDDKTLKISDNVRRTLARHFASIEQSHPK